MVNVIVLCIELLLDIVGLVLGILVYFSYSLIETGMDDFFKSRQFMYPYFADYMYSLLL